jgi:release factor glutamine methyltransferase
MKLKRWVEEAKQKVPRLDAELIACSALGFSDRADIILHWEDRFDFTLADEMVKKRESGTPLAYVVGFREFYGRKFKVNPNVLIPRPETEQVITSVLGIVDVLKKNDITILDVGTGSGCIPITLKLELEAEGVRTSVSAVDISAPALETAKENAKELKADVNFFYSDLLSGIDRLPDIITANLPYVDMNWDWTSPEIKLEPALALYSEDGGLAHIKKFLDQVQEKSEAEIERAIVKNMPPKFLVIEADTSQHDIIIEYSKERNIELVSRDGFILTMKY